MSIMGILNFKTDYHASQTASVFASDISRRITGASGLQEAQAARPEQSAEQAKLDNLQKLESSLAGTVGYMVEQHGEQAGTAMMALVYKRLGEGEVTEERLGQALLDVTRFIDKNFGFAAGDGFMEHLNGGLNRSMNEYFDNGLNETFFAVTNGQMPAAPQVPQTGEDGVSPAAEAARQFSEAVLDILEQARQGNESRAEETLYGPEGKRLNRQDWGQLVGVMREQFV